MGKNNSKQNNFLKLIEDVFVAIAESDEAVTKETLKKLLVNKRIKESQINLILKKLEDAERINVNNGIYSIPQENILTGIVTSKQGKFFISYEGKSYDIPSHIKVEKGQQVDFTLTSANSHQKSPVILEVYDKPEPVKVNRAINAKVLEEYYAKQYGCVTYSNDSEYKAELDKLEAKHNEVISQELPKIIGAISIDPDGKNCDKDDCIKINVNKKGDLVLQICIANLPEYIEKNSKLAKYADQQAQTFYGYAVIKNIYDNIISHGYCSLDKDKPKCCEVFEFTIDPVTSNIKHFNFYKAIVETSENFSYKDCEDLLDAHPEYTREYIINKLKNGEKLSSIESLAGLKHFVTPLMEKRHEQQLVRNGNKAELEVSYDSNYENPQIKAKERFPYENYIEVAMLLVNEHLAKYAFINKLYFIYRSHGEPSDKKVDYVKELLATHGIEFDGDLKTPEGIEALEDALKNTDLEEFTSEIKARLMTKAHYGTTPDPTFFDHANSILNELIKTPGKKEIYNELIRRYSEDSLTILHKPLSKQALDVLKLAIDKTEYANEFHSIYDRLIAHSSNNVPLDKTAFDDIIKVSNLIFFNKNVEVELDNQEMLNMVGQLNLYKHLSPEVAKEVSDIVIESHKSQTKQTKGAISLKDIDYETLSNLLFVECPEVTNLISNGYLKLDSTFDENKNISVQIDQLIKNSPMFISHMGLYMPLYTQDTAPIRRCDIHNLRQAQTFKETGKMAESYDELAVTVEKANAGEKNEVQFEKAKEDIASLMYAHKEENLNKLGHGHILTFMHANRYKGVYDLFALVENEEGYKFRIPVYELFKTRNVKFDECDVHFSDAGSALVNSKGKILASAFDKVEFIISGCNYDLVQQDISTYPEAYASTCLQKVFDGENPLKELEYLNEQLLLNKKNEHTNQKSHHSSFNETTSKNNNHSKKTERYKPTHEEKEEKSSKRSFNNKKRMQRNRESKHEMDSYTGKINIDDYDGMDSDN